ncbi:hypothetical protein [Myxococcus sp. CA039A]|uniref:hypothetical protein n=1 Tax=Myxococcus sp. CA039A TaxID=2741737 RepID=UPI00157B07A1|nr:hypothetical protein [Myxococcus sp. CA039A]
MKLNLPERQLCGRASFDLLRCRVLLTVAPLRILCTVLAATPRGMDSGVAERVLNRRYHGAPGQV